MEKTENWKVEVKRLDAIREKLGLNFNQIQKLTGIDRAKIGGFFNMKNQPSLGFYLTVKGVLEKEIEVNTKEKKEVHRDGGVSVSEINKKEKKGSVPKMINPPPPPLKKSETTCDCKMNGMLFIRGKSGCKKTKDEHKF